MAPEVSAQDRWFLIRVDHPGRLWVLPILAFLVFLWIVLLATGTVLLPAAEDELSLQEWALAGSAVLVVLLAWELVLLIGRKRSVKAGRQAAAAAAEPAEVVEAVPATEGFEAEGFEGTEEAVPEVEAEPAPAQGYAPLHEYAVTAEVLQGRRVVEYRRPPKALAAQAVFAKTYIPVSTDLVLRVEEIVAEPG